MSDIDENEPDDELDLAPETVEDLDAEDAAGDEVKGGRTGTSKWTMCG